ncbi:656_t:CDS:1 [Diversispora eburnea]|uniref:656_t:CDS:1 n=1 Tax=Diversispora eburnea TaxID=1213867 RepID=A0A9N8VT11_9GLOM|nr:656_t:CDS:1 [Diversispora eburnea]
MQKGLIKKTKKGYEHTQPLNKISYDSETINVTWKPLLPRPPTISSSSIRLSPMTSTTNSFTLETTPDTCTPISTTKVKTNLMPILLEAAAEAALRDKRQERMVKNRAAAYESRKRKREQAERLNAENEEMKERIISLEVKIAELTRENERYKRLFAEKEGKGE